MQIDTISEVQPVGDKEKLARSAKDLQKYPLSHQFFEKPYPL